MKVTIRKRFFFWILLKRIILEIVEFDSRVQVYGGL